MNARKVAIYLVLTGMGGASLSTLAQVDVPLLVKPLVLLLPLQVAALGYVVSYWRDRRQP